MMKKLLNTLYVLSEDIYLSCENENVVLNRENTCVNQIPLHTLEQILYFGYKGASPVLMGKCAEEGIGLSFFTPNGRFLSSVYGENRGNVLLRKQQYRTSESDTESLAIARNMIFGKLYNTRSLLERFLRDHPMQLDIDKVKKVSEFIRNKQKDALKVENTEILRGIEGVCAQEYFSCFGELILQNRDGFYFSGRNRRPPLDAVNAMLSFMYTILAQRCANGLNAVGLDPYVGFLHTDRPGRSSLALDLMEELRSIMVDRFVLTSINNRLLHPSDFDKKENGAVIMSKESRKKILAAWQEHLSEKITHPFLSEKIEWGLVPFVQAQLLSRYLRGDLDAYPPFLWK